MQYSYKYRVKESDIWQASMYYAYSSYMGVVNVVCIIASIALIVSKWSEASDLFRTVMIIFLLMFTVVQPSIIWMRACSSLKNGSPELELTFSQAGVIVISDGKKQQVSWKKVVNVVKKPTILLVYLEDGTGYILRNSVVKEDKEKLYGFIKENLQKNRIKNN
ncbi:MAG: hypothetical protein K6E98_00190 [Lachnospiraceae bacterium]|nr:hypothetical protein [Lachnospiraceae bacterium]